MEMDSVGADKRASFASDQRKSSPLVHLQLEHGRTHPSSKLKWPLRQGSEALTGACRKRSPLAVPARCQRVEVGDTVLVEHHCLAINHKMLLAPLECGFADPRELFGPVMTTSADQPHTVVLANEHQPVTIVLDLVDPSGAGGHLVCFGGERELRELNWLVARTAQYVTGSAVACRRALAARRPVCPRQMKEADAIAQRFKEAS
jgi:hypothetical protein